MPCLYYVDQLLNMFPYGKHDLDYILEQADALYKSLNTEHMLSVEYLLQTIHIEGYNLNINMLATEIGELSLNNYLLLYIIIIFSNQHNLSERQWHSVCYKWLYFFYYMGQTILFPFRLSQ